MLLSKILKSILFYSIIVLELSPLYSYVIQLLSPSHLIPLLLSLSPSLSPSFSVLPILFASISKSLPIIPPLHNSYLYYHSQLLSLYPLNSPVLYYSSLTITLTILSQVIIHISSPRFHSVQASLLPTICTSGLSNMLKLQKPAHSAHQLGLHNHELYNRIIQ
jgi:hypothetical protein